MRHLLFLPSAWRRFTAASLGAVAVVALSLVWDMVPPTRAMADPDPIIVSYPQRQSRRPIITEAWAEPFVVFDPHYDRQSHRGGWRNNLFQH